MSFAAAPPVGRAVASFPRRFSQRRVAGRGGAATHLRGAVLPGRRGHGSGDPCRAESGRSTSCGRSRRRRRAERARPTEGATGAVEKVCGRAGKIPGRRAALQPPREIPERGLKHRDACRRRLVPGRRPASSGFSGERKPACARAMRPSLCFSPAPFSLVDPHLHLWALRRLNYPWPAGVPSLHRRHLSEGDRRACGPVTVTHRQLAPPITLVRQCPAVRFVFR